MGRVWAGAVGAAGIATTAAVLWAAVAAAPPGSGTLAAVGSLATSPAASASSAPASSAPTQGAVPVDGVPDVVPRPEWGTPADATTAAPALAVVRDYLSAADTAYGTLDSTAFKDEHLAIGAAQGEVRAGVAELESAQRHQVGAVTIARATAFSQQQPHRLLVVACIDSSAVQVVESSGYAVRPAAARATRADLNLYVVQQTGKRWVVHSHAMPDDTRCDR